MKNLNRSLEFCKCTHCSRITTDTTSDAFGYWDICCDCGKRLEDGFHYYDHYDGEDHDDVSMGMY